MRVTAQQVFQAVEMTAPLTLAENWDHSGFQCGDRQAAVTAVVTALDVDSAVVEYACEKGANLIVAHHPLIFHGIREIDLAAGQGALLKALIQKEISVYAAHTNLDVAAGGLNDCLAVKLGLTDIMLLGETHREPMLKLAVFVPIDHLEAVRIAVSEADAGHTGNYSHCTFTALGTGTFKPLPGSTPFIGQEGTVEEVNEGRLETIVPASKLPAVLQAMMEAHPYEEVAYDLYSLPRQVTSFSYGRMGVLEQELSLRSLAEHVKQVFQLNQVRYAGDPERIIRRVGLVSGAGSSLIPAAMQSSCDVLITGDLKYHESKDALDAGLAVIDAAHDGLERSAADILAQIIEQAGLRQGWDVPVYRYPVPLLFSAV